MGQFYWHVHHDTLVEWSDDIDERLRYIRENKPENEVETRLRLLRPVVGSLPRLDQAWTAYNQVKAAYNQAKPMRMREPAWQTWAAYDQAQAAYHQAQTASEVTTLHAAECPDCPWDGETIFP